MDLQLALFDDARARAWQPFRLTRPVGELRFGTMTLRERSERATGLRAVAYLGCDDLVGFDEPGAPEVVPSSRTLSERSSTQAKVVLSSRAALEKGASEVLQRQLGATDTQGAARAAERMRITVGGQTAGWLIPAEQPFPDDPALADPGKDTAGSSIDLAGTMIEWPWHLVEANPDRIAADVATMQRGSHLFALTDVRKLGDHTLSLGSDAHVEPGVVVDLREGPIRLDAKVYIQAPARLTGPLHIGEGSVVFGGSIGHSSIGPVCKVRGEIDSSIMVGYCNKAHDGYLGHALLGRWVNLGALTTNSDLKNNYSAVRVRLGEQDIDTGLMKVGCFLGDHVKTGIGTLITTGCVVGAGSNVFGGKILPRYVPPFSWGSGADLVEFRVEELLNVAEVAMGRRKMELSAGAKDLLRRAWDHTRAERQSGERKK
jgi:UDP-N-acetylglucosamine diphosphorylase/glucosamine-1-phosphate N-acetyltransferase